MNNNLLNGVNIDSNLQPYTINTTAVDGGITLIDDGTSAGILSGQISTALGQGTTSTTHGNWWSGNVTTITSSPSWKDTEISISDSIFDGLKNSLLEIKKDEILDDVKKFCNDFCFLGCEGLCDGETKSQCPLWNRLKCEGKV